jgi:hypothetical protein
MKKVIALLFTCIVLTTGNANDTSIAKPVVTNNTVQTADSAIKKEQDSTWQVTFEENGNNLNSLMKKISERDRTEKQQMYLRFGLGLLFLVVLIIGLLRRRKRKAA